MKKISNIFSRLISSVEKAGIPGDFDNLREKGVECSIIIPLLEDMGYDPLTDIQYEVKSPKRTDQRFDFVFGDSKYIGTPKEMYNIVLEVKSLGTNINIDSGSSFQIKDYILHHDDINFGILSNGIDYVFFLQKDFIIKELKKEDFNSPGHGSVLPIFSIGRKEMMEGRTAKILEIFNKKTYIDTIIKLASLCYKTITGEGTRREVLTGDDETNKYIRSLIEEQLISQRGELFEELVNKNIKEKDIIKYSCKNFSIIFKVDKFGKILLEGKECILINNYNEIIKEEYGLRLTDIASQLIKNKNVVIVYNGPEDFLQYLFDRDKSKVPDSKVLAKEMRDCFKKHLKK